MNITNKVFKKLFSKSINLDRIVNKIAKRFNDYTPGSGATVESVVESTDNTTNEEPIPF